MVGLSIGGLGPGTDVNYMVLQENECDAVYVLHKHEEAERC